MSDDTYGSQVEKYKPNRSNKRLIYLLLAIIVATGGLSFYKKYYQGVVNYIKEPKLLKYMSHHGTSHSVALQKAIIENLSKATPNDIRDIEISSNEDGSYYFNASIDDPCGGEAYQIEYIHTNEGNGILTVKKRNYINNLPAHVTWYLGEMTPSGEILNDCHLYYDNPKLYGQNLSSIERTRGRWVPVIRNIQMLLNVDNRVQEFKEKSLTDLVQ